MSVAAAKPPRADSLAVAPATRYILMRVWVTVMFVRRSRDGFAPGDVLRGKRDEKSAVFDAFQAE